MARALIGMLLAISSILVWSDASAQQSSPTPPPQLVVPSPAAQQIMNSTLEECVEAGFFGFQCATLVYESPTTVVLNGETLILGGDPSLFQGSESFDPESSPVGNYPNPFLWKVVDAFKAQGYAIDSITIGGVGSRGNPNEFFVVMSKP
jgi:hypothetical protein